MCNTPAIILAGGMGTRLNGVVSDVPKPMAEIHHKPFLHYLFNYLQKNEVAEVILSVGYLYEKIVDYFGHQYLDINIEYSIENEPLGTGGAIKKAMEFINEDTFILNGDTFFDIDLQSLKNEQNDIQLALKQMYDFDRYGTVNVNEDNLIVAFNEKKACKEGLINGGIYYAKKTIFDNINLPTKFSFESVILEKNTSKLRIGATIYDNYFIDIGIPEDYYKAKIELL
ncbi:MAG: nucleotidyltransferase family protein [Chitinophagales bacterium]|nr:nucleotidyltransferase family protein [Chitinophagales bacterium]